MTNIQLEPRQPYMNHGRYIEIMSDILELSQICRNHDKYTKTMTGICRNHDRYAEIMTNMPKP